jgi:hypothetical protein
MEDQPQEPPTQEADGRPAIFKNINGVIAGVTGLVIAVGGLFSAYSAIRGDKKEEQPAVEAPATAAEPVAAAALPAKDEDLPTYYEGDDATLEFADNRWVLTTSEGTYEYKEMFSPVEDRVLAYDKTNDEYLRWPVKGGMSEMSKDEATWTNWITLDPTTPPAEGSDTAE